MPIKNNNNFEKLPLELKSISINKVKNMHHNILYKREYEAVKTENDLATAIHSDTLGLYGIKPTQNFYAPVDFILYNNKLNIKLYIELKDRLIPDIYDTLIINKNKVCTIINEELYPTYVINTFSTGTYVYIIDNETFLTEYERDEKFIYVPKSICFTYQEFISKLSGIYFTAYNFNNLNQNTIIP